MKKRRAFLASAAAVASGGCLGRITADPVFVLDAETVERTESAIVPELNVVEEEVTEESPAAIEIAVHNRSFRDIWMYAHGPGEGGETWGLVGSATSRDDRMRLTEPRSMDRLGQPPHWVASPPLGGSLVRGTGVLPLRSRSITLAVGAVNSGTPVDPASYHFEQRYAIEGGVEDVDWAFELILSEPGL